MQAGTSGNEALQAQRDLVRALADPACYPHAAGRVSVIETHISFVVLTGAFAYKIKKAVDLGFLDFTTLDKRRFCCEEELRLNRRLAPAIYLDVVAISGTADAPRIAGAGEPIEYAVRMREFPQDDLLDRVLHRGALASRHLDALAAAVADFHDRVARAAPTNEYGDPAAIKAPMEQNFAQLRALLDSAEDHAALDAVEAWSGHEYARLRQVFAGRKRAGFVRECHGDLHLGNIALLDGALQIFDCIEFNANFRWIDVASEIAFLVMDLSERGRPDYANRFLNDYLEIGGDYGGLQVLPFYLVYRAVVRAKIARIRAAQERLAPEERRAALATWAAYIGYARQVAVPRPRAVMITHGLSGSGKTFLAQALLEALGAVRIRSDVERKRLHRLPALARSRSAVGDGLYSREATAAVYEQLARLARLVVEAGFPVVVDAAFLEMSRRDRFRALARELAVPFLILDCRAPEPVLRERIVVRERGATDASEATQAVLESQLRAAEPLAEEEAGAVLSVDTASESIGDVVEKVKRRLWQEKSADPVS